MNIFFCDIVGTFDGKTNRERNIKEFVNNLLNLMKLDKLDNLFFSFISSDSIDIVNKFVDEISEYLKNTNINLGIQFASDGSLYDGIFTKSKNCSKIDQMISFVKNKKINNLYYADDSVFNQKLIGLSIEKYCPEINMVRFFPGTNRTFENKVGVDQNGIEGLNKILLKYFKIKLQKKSQKRAKIK